MNCGLLVTMSMPTDQRFDPTGVAGTTGLFLGANGLAGAAGTTVRV